VIAPSATRRMAAAIISAPGIVVVAALSARRPAARSTSVSSGAAKTLIPDPQLGYSLLWLRRLVWLF